MNPHFVYFVYRILKVLSKSYLPLYLENYRTMLYSISGAQGTGKSTILNTMADRGCKVIERKTARSVLIDNDWTLSDVYTDHEKMKVFQMEVLKRKIMDDEKYYSSRELVFTERSYADLFTYTTMILGSENTHSSWLNEYYDLCEEHNNQYAGVFYLMAGHFDVEDDGVRGYNKHYSTMISASILSFLEKMSPDKITEIHEVDITERCTHITKRILIDSAK